MEKQNQQPKEKKQKKEQPIPPVKISKNLAYILRHAAEKEGIPIRADGFVPLALLLLHPRFKGVSKQQVEKVVQENDKKRFMLVGVSGDVKLDGLQADETQTIFKDTSVPESELNWFIRANQGHSLELDVDLEPITTPPAVCVHGTNQQAWENIQKTAGLSRMKRTHVHFAPGTPQDGVVSGMRATSTVLIYVNVQKAMDAGLKFFKSANDVILCGGDANGVISSEFFEKVVVLPSASTPTN